MATRLRATGGRASHASGGASLQVLYDAGVDVWEGDGLGHLKLSHAGIWSRDRYVIETCVRSGVPIACVIGGGYDRDPLALARRHALLHRAAARVWRESARLSGSALAEVPLEGLAPGRDPGRARSGITEKKARDRVGGPRLIGA